MKYRMLALDLDGTLLDSQGRVSAEQIDAVNRAKAAGVLVVLCTGRGLRETRSAVQQLDHHGPIVLANGSMVSDPTTGKTLHRVCLEPHLALKIVDELDAGPDSVLVLLDPEPTGLDYLVTSEHQVTPNSRWWFEAMEARVRYVEQATEDDLHHALRIGIVGEPTRMPAIMAELRGKFGQSIFTQHFTAVKKSDEELHVLEVFAGGVNKWAGLEWLAENHDIAPEQVAAIGDEINDVQMIDGAGCGIAMANAVEQVAAIADRRTLSNEEHGVAHAIDRMLEGTW